MLDKRLLEIKKECLAKREQERHKSNFISNVRLVIFLFFVVFLGIYFKTGSGLYLGISILLFIGFIVLVIIHRKVDETIEKLDFRSNILSKYERRIDDEWKKEEVEEVDIEDDFANDLNIVGKSSLFQFIDFTSSLGGKMRLVEKLSLKKVKKKEISESQKAIEELREDLPFIFEFQEKLGMLEEVQKTDFKTLFTLFNKSERKSVYPLVLSLLFSVSTWAVGILSLLGFVPYYIFIFLMLWQLGSSYFYMNFHPEEFDAIAKYARLTSRLSDIFDFVASKEFTSKKNRSLVESVRKGKTVLKKAIKLAEMDMYRSNFVTYSIANIFFSLNFVLLYKYDELVSLKAEEFKSGIEAIEEFECEVSLLTIALVKKETSIPVIRDDMSLEVLSVRHPLIKDKVCVDNDFNSKDYINIITGSNMSGKTSFMKTIGINLVLAYLGTYVCASKFEAPIMKIFTSINVQDDIAHGISTFYGELKRIKNIIDYSKKNSFPIVAFIDEIFKGTNYNDRILGAKETLKQFAKLNTMIFLTTHDFELCELKNKKCVNYHFKERYEKDKISFDYKIRDGRCKTTNAKYLMKEMGILK